jgi:hypothetical protein
MYYDWEGNPISMKEWSHLYGQESRFMKQDTFVHGDHIVKVSTVYLGLDHSFALLGRAEDHIPIIFETMIFSTDETVDQRQWRYATEKQALNGHELAIKLVEEDILGRHDEHL